ncbi:cystathionine beta-synthase [Rozella allomycis CSF55]|uniref:Cystathionine beta-synthase n=1 Tax=Rozella allomycis (strain CSF55) TaxID=988480 RepID=A0A075B4E8_ROZAC|nr:Tryptophan synthase beta subunit-like protein [Rozella allomycis CSF55]RKP19172.1 cystathionine beta-synthase [Rozella allomycis CSF55]|eukprot:EPZ36305.1 Tryptophan synthase beta subunit-like protein [Rozella allomycis CSF55]
MTEKHLCTWSIDKSISESPHHHLKPENEPEICNTILDYIGNTPLVRLHSIPAKEKIECEILAKCEYFNAGGSVKDRIGKRMIEEAERDGRLKPGFTIIEPTSGNTGIGLGLAAAVKGYKVIITLPEKMSQEKVDVLKALGAEIIRTPTEAPYDSPESHIGVAKRLNQEIPNSIILDQYANPYNPIAHYDTTAEEILRQTNGNIDAIVAGAGTGGTITGIARKLRERIPNVKIYGVDPHGSLLAVPDTLNTTSASYKVEGIGYDFIPKVLDRPLIDEWIKTNDMESFTMARRIIREEGLLCGGSSGSAMAATIKIAKKFKKGQRVVVILPDSVRNYMSKFLNDKWMLENGFLEGKKNEKIDLNGLNNATIKEMNLPRAITLHEKSSVNDAVNLMKKHGIDQIVIVTTDFKLKGIANLKFILSKLFKGEIQLNDSVELIREEFKVENVNLDTSVGQALDLLQKSSLLIVTDSEKVIHVISQFDVLNFMTKNLK